MRMKIVDFTLSVLLSALCFFGAILFALRFPVEAQQAGKVHRIGFLISASAEGIGSETENYDATEHFIDAFRQGLRELGYVEGKNFVLEIRWGEAKRDRLSNLAAELVRLKVDLIVAEGGWAIQAAKKATRVIPIVMRTGSDPVKRGFVASLAHPGGNITGMISLDTGLSGKRLELLAEVVPGVKRIAVLTSSHKFMARDEYKEMEAAARALGVKLQILKAQDPNTIESAFLAMSKERAEALNVTPSIRFIQHLDRIRDLAIKNRLPSMHFHGTYVETGGLMFYGANVAAEYRRTARIVDKILKGANTADLPVEQATTYELVINLKTAKQLGIAIPPVMLMQADRVIR